MSVEATPALVLVYDGECPFCRRYTHYIRLRENIAQVELVNGRDGRHWAVGEVQLRGLDLNDGMVAIYRGEFYHGENCIRLMAMLSSRQGVFNFLNALIFRSRTISRLLYPVLRFGRSITLLALGRPKIGTQPAISPAPQAE